MNTTDKPVETTKSVRVKQTLRRICNMLLTRYATLAWLRSGTFYAIDKLSDDDIEEMQTLMKEVIDA